MSDATDRVPPASPGPQDGAKLSEGSAGDRPAVQPRPARELLPLVYDELRMLAAQRLSRETPGQSLQPTALVHEAYLRLVGQDPDRPWDGRGHFFAAAAEAMRRILVESARRRRSLKRGGNRNRVDLDAAQPAVPELDDDLLALDEALEKLAAIEPIKAQVVQLRVFGGLTAAETSRVLGLSGSSTDRYWAYARAWLRVEIAGRESGSQDEDGPGQSG
jgi:RNA polymerase sigma factor (TIGR02999 family)